VSCCTANATTCSRVALLGKCRFVILDAVLVNAQIT